MGSKGWPGRLGIREMDRVPRVRYFTYVISLSSHDNSLKWVL